MRTIAAAGFLLVMAFGVSACSSGGGALSLEEYFEKLQEADEKQTEKTDAIGERLADTEDIEEIKDAFGEFPAILDDFLDDLEGLEPPEEAEDAHNEAVEAGRDFLEEFDELMEDIEDAESIDDLLGATESSAFTGADERLTEACNELQSVADENDIDVNLDCED